MKLWIFDEKKEEKEKEVFLRLVRMGESVSVRACQENGRLYSSGWLISFNVDGTLYRAPNISKALPFQFDEKGRIELKD